MSVRRLLGVAVIILAVVPTASGSVGAKPAVTPPPGVYTGIAIGGVDRYRHLGNSKTAVESDSADSYRVRIDFTFTIAADGATQGTGNGVYTLATWHLQGRNGNQGTFNCTIPITANPFAVTETMPARQFPIVELGLQTSDAKETNANYDCGAGYSGFATNSEYISESLARVIWHVKFDATHPVFQS